MTKTCFELRAALDKLFIRQSWLAQLCGVKPLQVWRWCDGKAQIPQYVWTILSLIEGQKHHAIIRGEMPSWEIKRHHVYRNAKSFKELAKRFHPDITGIDTTAEMQIINKFRKQG